MSKKKNQNTYFDRERQSLRRWLPLTGREGTEIRKGTPSWCEFCCVLGLGWSTGVRYIIGEEGEKEAGHAGKEKENLPRRLFSYAMKFL